MEVPVSPQEAHISAARSARSAGEAGDVPAGLTGAGLFASQAVFGAGCQAGEGGWEGGGPGGGAGCVTTGSGRCAGAEVRRGFDRVLTFSGVLNDGFWGGGGGLDVGSGRAAAFLRVG